jgi:hypothetical protein
MTWSISHYSDSLFTSEDSESVPCRFSVELWELHFIQPLLGILEHDHTVKTSSQNCDEEVPLLLKA